MAISSHAAAAALCLLLAMALPLAAVAAYAPAASYDVNNVPAGVQMRRQVSAAEFLGQTSGRCSRLGSRNSGFLVREGAWLRGRRGWRGEERGLEWER